MSVPGSKRRLDAFNVDGPSLVTRAKPLQGLAGVEVGSLVVRVVRHDSPKLGEGGAVVTNLDKLQSKPVAREVIGGIRLKHRAQCSDPIHR